MPTAHKKAILSMDVLEAIRTRRSIKEFTSRSPDRDEIALLLSTATAAPNHRMTQPWRFYVLGPETRRAYGQVLGARKAAKVTDAEAARAIVDKVVATESAVPAVIAVSVALNDNPEIREEDYAAAMMGIENLLLAATSRGWATHLKTGAVMDDSRTRSALHIPEGERIVAMIQLGEPASGGEAKPRRDASELTTWLP